MFGKNFTAALFMAAAVEAQRYFTVDWNSRNAFINMVGVQPGLGQPVDWDINIESLKPDYREEVIELDVITTYDATWTDDDAFDDFNSRTCTLGTSAEIPRTVTDNLALGLWNNGGTQDIRGRDITSTDLDFFDGQKDALNKYGSDIYMIIKRQAANGDTILACGEIIETTKRNYDWIREFYLGLQPED